MKKVPGQETRIRFTPPETLEQAEQDEPRLDWRKKPDTEDDPDDELLPVTPPDVVAILGLDPLELFSGEETEDSEEDEEGDGKEERSEKGGPGSGHFGHSGRPGKVGGSDDGDGGAIPALRPDEKWDGEDGVDENLAMIFRRAKRGYVPFKQDTEKMLRRLGDIDVILHQMEKTKSEEVLKADANYTRMKREQSEIEEEMVWRDRVFDEDSFLKYQAVKGVSERLPEDFNLEAFDFRGYRGVMDIGGYDGLSPEGKRRACVDAVVKQWAATANDHDMNALEFQLAVSEEFGMEGSAWLSGRLLKMAESPNKEHVRELRKVARAMYENTQDKLGDLSDSVSLFRGVVIPVSEMKPSSGGKSIRIVPASLNPASSWSYDFEVADNFTGGYSGERDYRPYILKSIVPKKAILSTAISGNGCFLEKEVIVLGVGGEVSALEH